eukprot:maker-scaffold_38-snap-gene-0.39-mRNA-1 protein AED:0.00 eAED:0.00 QI:130/1/1/1/1/1/2/121/343
MKILILGNGANASVLGHLFTRFNPEAKVVFLINEKRVKSFKEKSQISIYAYDEPALLTFSRYTSLPVSALDNEQFRSKFSDVDIFITSRQSIKLKTETGKKLLEKVNENIPSYAIVLSLTYDITLQEKAFSPAGFSPHRIVYGVPLFAAHKVPSSGQSGDQQHTLVNKAQLAYHFLISTKFPLLISSNPKKTLSTALSIGSGGKVLNYGETVCGAFAVHRMICHMMLLLQSFPAKLNTKDLRFISGVGAFNQIMVHYGKFGKFSSFTIGGQLFNFTESQSRKRLQPLDEEFIRANLSDKVVEENIHILDSFIMYGRERGKSVDRIVEFVGYLKARGDPFEPEL